MEKTGSFAPHYFANDEEQITYVILQPSQVLNVFRGQAKVIIEFSDKDKLDVTDCLIDKIVENRKNKFKSN